MRYRLMNVHDIKIEGHDAKEAAQPAPEAAHEADQEPFQKRKKTMFNVRFCPAKRIFR
jgi:hypothetical protein